jgi:fibronectin type 3 domain-containing protein
VPTGLAAVANPADNNAPASIDLNWQPVSDPTLSGYFVYRREGDGVWRRISGDQAIVPPAFHDAEVQPGHTYTYAVSAVNQTGHESARSTETEETVPTQ